MAGVRRESYSSILNCVAASCFCFSKIQLLQVLIQANLFGLRSSSLSSMFSITHRTGTRDLPLMKQVVDGTTCREAFLKDHPRFVKQDITHLGVHLNPLDIVVEHHGSVACARRHGAHRSSWLSCSAAWTWTTKL